MLSLCFSFFRQCGQGSSCLILLWQSAQRTASEKAGSASSCVESSSLENQICSLSTSGAFLLSILNWPADLLSKDVLSHSERNSCPITSILIGKCLYCNVCQQWQKNWKPPSVTNRKEAVSCRRPVTRVISAMLRLRILGQMLFMLHSTSKAALQENC